MGVWQILLTKANSYIQNSGHSQIHEIYRSAVKSSQYRVNDSVNAQSYAMTSMFDPFTPPVALLGAICRGDNSFASFVSGCCDGVGRERISGLARGTRGGRALEELPTDETLKAESPD